MDRVKQLSVVTLKSLSAETTLTKNGAGSLTLGMANAYSGGTLLEAGGLRLGNNAALGVGPVQLDGGALSSDSASARTVGNAVLITGDITLGDSVNPGTLTLSGPADYTGGVRDMTCLSDVVFSGSTTNGQAGKEGLFT